MLIMASVIRVGQSKFVNVPIDEDSSERIMNCIATLSELEEKPAVHELFLKDTKSAFSKMLSAQEVRHTSTLPKTECSHRCGTRRKRLRRRKTRRRRRLSLFRSTTC